MGICIAHEPCPNCGSKDNLARYEDGGAYCFGCSYVEKPGGTPMETNAAPRGSHPIVQGTYKDLPSRGLSEEDCRHWGYQTGELHDEPVHIMNYRDAKGSPVGQKFRTADKRFSWHSESKTHPLYGAWLWPSKGKSIVITEGELDALSVSKAFGHKWPVVSLPDGTGSVKRTLPASYEWLDGFDKIVLWFDNDEHGRKALDEAVELLPPGKVYVARSPEGCKDANDTLRKHGVGAVTRAFWDATAFRPDGIKDGRDFTYENVMVGTPPGVPYPWPKLQEMTYGLRPAEVTMLTAGSGMGKSTLARELAYYLTAQCGKKVGNIFLEEQNTDTVRGYAGIHNNVPSGLLKHKPELLTKEQFDSAMEAAVWDKMYFYDHFGSVASDHLIQKIGYFRRALGCDFVILDHVSIVTSGLESGSEGERRDIDMLMTKLAQVTQQTGVSVIAIVHLKRKLGTPFNEGGQVSLTDLRGSAALEQLSWNVFALERDQQAEGAEACDANIRVLKCRASGNTGLADTLRYDRDTGRLVEAPVTSKFDPDGASRLEEEMPF